MVVVDVVVVVQPRSEAQASCVVCNCVSGWCDVGMNQTVDATSTRAIEFDTIVIKKPEISICFVFYAIILLRADSTDV